MTRLSLCLGIAPPWRIRRGFWYNVRAWQKWVRARGGCYGHDNSRDEVEGDVGDTFARHVAGSTVFGIISP